MELRNAVSKETLRKYLLTSSAEAIPQARPSLLSCFTNAENPKPQLQDRLSAAGEALESCSETALQSWFDPLEILLDQEAGTLAVRLIPVPGKTVGERAEFGGLLGGADIMAVQKGSAAGFINRGGRIPAPIHSFKN